MPQPLSRVPHAGGLVLFNTSLSHEPTFVRPRLAVLGMTVISRFSTVDTFLLRSYVKLMGGPKGLAADMFLRMETRGARLSAITALSERLPDEQQKVLKEIIKATKTTQKTRDKIAHWTWGYLPDKEDCILLADPKDLIRNEPDISKKDILVYFENDFQFALSSINHLIELLIKFERN